MAARAPPRPVPVIAAKFVEREEGVKFRAYRDKANIWTIGSGHTGPEVKDGLVWTQDQIDKALISDMAIAAARLENACTRPRINHLNDHQYAALLSFVFNDGERLSWEIWKDIRNGDWGMVPVQLRRFDIVSGKVNAGLDNRREAEIALWRSADPLCMRYPAFEGGSMSWFSRAENAFISLVTGKGIANTAVIANPKTPVESAINAAAGIVIPIAASLPGSSAAATSLEGVKTVVNGLEGHPDPGVAAQANTASDAVGGISTTLGTEAAMAANNFLTSKVGTTSTQMADAGAEALAVAAITMMSSSKNMAIDDIANQLHLFVLGFEKASGVVPQ